MDSKATPKALFAYQGMIGDINSDLTRSVEDESKVVPIPSAVIGSAYIVLVDAERASA